MRSPMPYGCFALIVLAGMLLFPIFLADVFLTALGKLGLSRTTAFLAAAGIFLGGLINIPVTRIAREEPIDIMPVMLFGLRRFFKPQYIQRTYTVIAVNLGGAIIPTVIAIYEILRMAARGSSALVPALIAIGVNIGVSYWLARPVEGVGIAMPALVPGLVAGMSGLLLASEFAASVAFSAGVLGPLIGADLFHMDDISKIGAPVASIGGAGTFDGIVISGFVATILA